MIQHVKYWISFHSQYLQKSVWMDVAVGETELFVKFPTMLFGAKYCRLLPL